MEQPLIENQANLLCGIARVSGRIGAGSRDAEVAGLLCRWRSAGPRFESLCAHQQNRFSGWGLAQTSNKIIQKGLAFLRNRSSTAFNSGR